MAVDPAFKAKIVEALSTIVSIRVKAMFGGLGIYGDELFFACVDNNRVFFKVDDSNRPDYIAKGMGPFKPIEDAPPMNGYYELPPSVLDDPTELAVWVQKSLHVSDVANRKKSKKPSSSASRQTRR